MNKRNTTQRSLILEAVKELHCHVTADAVFHTIVKKYPHISRATVYRNLNLLSETGEMRKIEMPNGADRYDHRCSEHYHARCVKCGRIFDVETKFNTEFEKYMKDTHGFQLTGYDIIFKGICFECNQ